MQKLDKVWQQGVDRILLSLSVILYCSMAAADVSLDPKVTSNPDEPVTLEECLTIALQNNSDLVMAQWDDRAAGERVKQARGSLLPSLSFAASYDGYGQTQRVIPPRSPGDAGVFDERAADYGITGRIPLFRGGKGWNTLKVAQLEHTATVWETERSRDLVVFAVTEAFYKIVGLDSLIAATQFSRRSLEAHYKQVEERIAVGKAARVDALRIKVRMADLDQTLAKLEDDREITVRLLVYRMGQEGRSEGVQVAAALEDPDVPWSLDGALKQAVSKRADYRAVRRRVEAQQKRWSMAKAGRWPEVILKGYYGGRSGGDLAFDDDWNVGVQLDMPLFVGGTIAARAREEKYKLRQMEEAERKFRLAIELEVRTAYRHLQQARRWIQTAGAVVEQAREVLRIAEERHRLGKGTVAEVLDAQAELLEAQTHVVQALVDRALAVAELEKATGITLPTRMKN